MGKFIPRLAGLKESFLQLLRKDTAWYSGVAQQTAFSRVKEMLTSPEVLAHYDLSRQATLLLMHHQLVQKHLYFRSKTADSAVLYVTSQDPSATLKRTTLSS